MGEHSGLGGSLSILVSSYFGLVRHHNHREYIHFIPPKNRKDYPCYAAFTARSRRKGKEGPEAFRCYCLHRYDFHRDLGHLLVPFIPVLLMTQFCTKPKFTVDRRTFLPCHLITRAGSVTPPWPPRPRRRHGGGS